MAHRDRQRKDRHGDVLPNTLRDTLGSIIPGEVDPLARALLEPPPTSIRLNSAKPGGPDGAPVPWCRTGRYLAERPVFTLDPLLHAGAYYVQEASSMLLEQAFLATGLLEHDIVALDLCAAPGGKSTHLRSLMTPGSLLVANEVDGRRRAILAENLWKWGSPNTVITGAEPIAFETLPGLFDLVLVDAPCSGEGMFRKDPFAHQQWSPELVHRCAAAQSVILSHAWEAIRPGGFLIYSTCTWEPTENEEQLLPLLARGAEPVTIATSPAWGTRPAVLPDTPGLRCYPHLLRGEGFFMALLRKPGDADPGERRIRPSGSANAPDVRTEWLDTQEDLSWIEHEETLHVVGTRHAPLVDTLNALTTAISPGIPVAVRKGVVQRPHAALALSTLLRRDAFCTIDLDPVRTLAYLRGEALPGTQANGTALIRHAGLGLGWAQGAGNRWNNGWPKPWRIRMRTT